MRRPLHLLLVAALVLASVALVAPGDVTAELSPPDGQTAVRLGQVLQLGGQVPPGSSPGAVLQAHGDADALLGEFDVTSRVSVAADGTVSGTVRLTCAEHVPGCLDATTSGERQAAIDAMRGYRLRLTVEDVSDTSARVDFDDEPPIILGYFLTSPTTVEVRFSEDVVDPDGDTPSDWLVNGLRQVLSVDGVGDTRVLTFLTPVDDDATPDVRYDPRLGANGFENVPYVDGARNELDAANRFSMAIDEIPPAVPTIEAIEGTEVTYAAQDEAEPVLGNDTAPEVTVGNLEAGRTAQLFLDDGDGSFEPGADDALVGEAVADGATVTIEVDALPADGAYRYYARALDDAACDPNEPSSGTCPNASGRSREAVYDLDTVAPTVGTVLGRSRTIAVPFSEPVAGTDAAGQWTVTNPLGGAVDVAAVSGSGAQRVLEFEGGPLVAGATLTWARPGDGGYVDAHGNELAPFTVPIDAPPLPLLTVTGGEGTEGDPTLLPQLDPPTVGWMLRLSEPVPTGETVSVAVRVVPGGEGDAVVGDGSQASHDVEAVDTTVELAEGQQELLVEAEIFGDLLDEFDEAAFLEATNADDTAPQFTLPDDASSTTTAATIVDDDPLATAALSSGSAEVGEGDGSLTLTVTLDTASGKPVTVPWSVARDGTAEAPDVADQSGVVTLPVGQTSATFEVAVADDTLDEPDETFSVALGAPTNADLGDPARTTVSIVDDDLPLPTLSVEPGSVDEDAAPLPLLTRAQLPVTFRLSTAPEQPIEVQWRTDDSGTATQDDDFAATSGTVRFEAGETEQQAAVPVLDDDLDEDDEQVAIVVADPAAAQLEGAEDGGSTTFEGTIVDDDPLPVLAFADDSDTRVVTEGDPVTLTVELDAVSGRDVAVDWATVDESTDRGDLPAQSGTVVVPAGSTSVSFEVTTLDDGDPEPDEVVLVELSSPQAAELGDPATSRLTLADDEVVLPTISLSASAGNEDPGLLPPLTTPSPVVFTVELSQEAPDDVTVRYRTTGRGDATAESDYTGTSGTVTIPQGETSATVDVEVLDDAVDEFDEGVELELREAVGARLPDGAPTLAGEGLIGDDDPVVVASFGDDVTVDEGEPLVVDVTLDTASGKRVQLDWTTVDQSADGSDYGASSGRLTFEPGQTTATITVPGRDDAEVEGDEDFRLELTVVDADTAALGDGELVATIIDDDVDLPGQNVVSLSSATVEEGDPVGPFPVLFPTGTLAFDVSLSAPADGDVEISFTSMAGSATPGEDVELEDGSVTIPSGEQQATIELGTYADLLDEVDETVLVAVTGVAGNATLPAGGLERTGRILDDDPLVAIAFAEEATSIGATEGDTVTFTVELDTASGKDVAVDWTTSYNGTASTDDVPPQSGTVNVPAGATSATFAVETLDDGVDEPDEDLSLALSSPVNASLGGARTATLVLDDDDLNTPVLSIEGGSVDEGAGGPLALLSPAQLVWDVTLDEAPEQDVSVEWRTLDSGTARAGSDFTAASGTLEVPAGETSAQLVVDVLDDDLDEFTESVVLRLSNAQGVVLEGGGPTLTEHAAITDDDPLVTAALGDDVEVVEGEPATFDVVLDAPSGKDVTLRVRTSDGTAAAPGDYTDTDRTFTIEAGQTSATVTVPTRDDSTPEPDEELDVTLAVVQDDTAELGRAAATLTITDDDLGVEPGDVVVSLTGASVEEGDPFTPLGLPVVAATLDFVVSLSEPADGDVTIAWQTVAGTATADEDFVADSGAVTVPDGEQEATVSIEVVPDHVDEPDEDLRLVLTDVSGDAVLPGGELARTGRILDDDPAPLLRVADATVLEGQVAAVEVTLDRASDRDVTVAWALSPGSADTSDYQDASGTLEFPAGTTSRTVEVTTLTDDTTELIEQFELVLSAPTNAALDDARGTISIVDLLGGQTAVFLEDVTVTETDSDRTVEVPVVLSNERDEDTVVTWTTQQLTATAGDDFREDGGEVTIPAGATSARIEVVVVGDDEQELTEDFLVLLTEADGAVITGPAGRVTIEDDDSDTDGGGEPGGPGDPGDGTGDGGGGGGGGVGADGESSGSPGGELPATGGGAGLAVIALAALLARRRRD